MKIIKWLGTIGITMFPFTTFGEIVQKAGEAAQTLEHGIQKASSVGDLTGLAIGLGFGLAALGGALGQAKIGSAFQEGVSRNPGASKTLFTPLILSLVFVETLVLFTFLIMYMLMGKL